MKKLLSWLTIFFTILSIAQKSKKDSILQLIQKNPSTEETVRNLNLLSTKYYKRQPDSSIILAQRSLRLAEELRYKDGIYSAKANIILARFRQGDFEDADVRLKELLQTGELDNYAQKSILFALGEVYFKKQILDSTLKYSLATLKASERSNDPPERLLVYHNNLSIDYAQKGYLDRAIFHNLSAIKLDGLLPEDLNRKTQLYINAGNMYRLVGGYKNALKYRQLAYETAKRLGVDRMIALAAVKLSESLLDVNKPQESKEKLDIASTYISGFSGQGEIIENFVYVTRAYYYKTIGDYDKAIDYYKKGMEVAEKAANKQDVLFISNNLAELQIELGLYNEAEKNLERALQIQTGVGDLISEKETYLLKARVDSIQGDIHSYVQSNWKYNQLKDSIASENTAKAIAQLEIEYETNLKDREIELLNLENENKETDQRRMRIIQISLATIVILLLILAFIMYKSNTSQKKSMVTIRRQNKENKLLVQETHHRVKNNLQIILSLLNVQASNLNSHPKLDMALAESRNRIKSLALIHEELYQHKTMSSVNSKFYFSRLIKNIMDSMVDSSGKINVVHNIEDAEIKMSIAVPMGLIINELLTNAVKYAFEGKESGTVNVTYSTNDGYHELIVGDDGVGFKDCSKKNYSFGLNLVEGLTKQYGGSFVIHPDKGETSFTVVLKEA